MICEECQTNEATCQLNVIVGSDRVTRYLCQDCLSKMQGALTMGIVASKVTNMLSSILSAITHEDDTEKESGDSGKVCPRCRTSLKYFRKSGRLGCPECYEVFREELNPMLKQIHGQVNHIGRRPLEGEEERKTRSLQEELTREMEEAVRTENFERAAEIRDQLRALAGEDRTCRI